MSSNAFLVLLPSQTAQNSRSQDLKTKEKKDVLFWKEDKAYRKDTVMVNNQGLIIHKTGHTKGKRHDYDIYKKNHPVTPKQVVNVFDLGYLGVEKDFPDQKSSIPNRKKPKRVGSRGKRVQPESLYKENGDRAHHLQDEKAQDTCRCFQKQAEKAQQGI